MACPKFTPKNATSLRRSLPDLIHPSVNQPHSPSQTVSGYNQPFCHRTLSRQTDWQTDRHTHTETNRWARRQIRAYARYTDRERCAKKYIQITDMNICFFKVLCVYLLADNLSSNKVSLCQAKPHLFQYKFNFLFLFHWAKCLYLSNIAANIKHTHCSSAITEFIRITWCTAMLS